MQRIVLIALMLLVPVLANGQSHGDSAINKIKGRVNKLTIETYRYNDEGDIVSRAIFSTTVESGLAMGEGEVAEEDFINTLKPSEKRGIGIRNGQGSYVYHYDKDHEGRLIQIEEFDCSEKKGLLSTTIYIYDQNGNTIEERLVLTDGSIPRKYQYKYDSNNLVSESIVNEDGIVEAEWLYKNDEFGNPIEEIFQAGNEIIQKIIYQYEYDRLGNWIERRTLKDNRSEAGVKLIPIYLTKRNIG